MEAWAKLRKDTGREGFLVLPRLDRMDEHQNGTLVWESVWNRRTSLCLYNLWQMETTPGLTHNAAGLKGACPRDSWPYVFLFSSQGKRKPSLILIYKTSCILVIIPSVAAYATLVSLAARHLVTCLFYKNSQCHLGTPSQLTVYNAYKFSFLRLKAQMLSKVSRSIIERITKSLWFYTGDGVGKGWGTGHYFSLRVGREIIGVF